IEHQSLNTRLANSPMPHRLEPAHHITPRAFRCPACKVVLPMRIEWPFWRCPKSSVVDPRGLVPAGSGRRQNVLRVIRLWARTRWPETAEGVPPGSASAEPTSFSAYRFGG